MSEQEKSEAQSLVKENHETILATTFIGQLSTVRHKDGHISTNPVSYIWNGEELEISTLKGRMKYKNVLANPRATLCVVSPKNHMHYVEIRGTVRVVDDTDRAYLRYQFKKLAGMDAPEDMDPPGSERVVLYLRPEQVSSPVLYGGRFDDQGSQVAE
ncbi:MAG: pyridoxamine 5'-phosphate oxidase family protein [Halioglobus sp.]